MPLRSIQQGLAVSLCALGLLSELPHCVLADERWHAPFGGSFSANFTATTDYSYAGISQTQLGPALQAGLDYVGPRLADDFPVWLYATAWGSTINFPTTGPGVEIDISAGVKFHAFNERLSVDLGYIRYAYPGIDAALGYDYGEINLNVGWDFGVATVAGRLRYSPNSFANSGVSWNKRGLVSVPLDFLRLWEIRFKSYASVGNIWVEKFLNYGIPDSDYWYWQIGAVASVRGFDLTIAYTATDIDRVSCGNTNYCSGRLFVSLTKTF